MKTTNMSIKQLATLLLSMLGVVFFILTIVAMSEMRTTAYESQAKSLSRIIEVSVRDSMVTLGEITQDLGAYTRKTKGFRETATALVNDPLNTDLKIALGKQLDEQFHQRFVTTSIVDLRKIKVYNLNFELLGESNEGDSSLPSSLPTQLLKKASGREGADRLKAIDSIWIKDDQILYSTLMPIGGLRQTGYMEIVVRPAHNLKNIENVLQMPVAFYSVKGREIYRSEKWQQTEVETVLPISYNINADNGELAMGIKAQLDVTAFHEGLARTQFAITVAIAVILGLSLIVSFWVLGKTLFKPANRLVSAIEKCAEGDLSVEIEESGLKELNTLSKALNILVHNLRQQVKVISGDSKRLADSSSDLTVVTEDTAQALLRQQSETESVATSMNELSASALEVSKNAENVAVAVRDADEEAYNGYQVVKKSVSAINELEGEVDLASEVMGNLQQESQNIGTVLDVIRGIAEQTNLLALNAAIEAARAGEQGRGFAVVADEVRTLAGRTQQSTQEIQSMIQSLQAGTSEAVTVMDRSREKTKQSVDYANEAGAYLEKITASVASMSEMTAQIATAAHQQSAVVETVNQSVVSIRELASKTSNGAQLVTNNSRDLTKMANELEGLVKHFKV
ncbi:methyl-accepting chemotaxis protein [Kaarinaea lacus]